MRALLDLFLDICLFRKGPQDVPMSWVLLKLTLLTYGMSSLLVLAVSLDPSPALLLTLADIGVLTGLTYAVLSFTNYIPRFVQTLTALLGTGTLIQLMALPIAIWTVRGVAQDTSAGLPDFLYLCLLGWSIAIIAHILHHALAVSRAMGFLYTLGYIVILWTISSWLESLP